MGMMQVKGDYSGKVYEVEFAGDNPTPEEIASASGQIQALERDFETKFEGIYGDQEIDDGTAVGRGLESGVTQLKSSFGTAVRRAGEGLDSNFVAGIGTGLENSARRTQLSRAGTATPFKTFDEAREGGLGDMASYIGEIAGQSGPQTLAGIGAAGLATLAVPAAPITAALTASTAALFPLFYGSNIQTQEKEIAAGNLDEIDNTKALQAAALQSTLNSIADKLLIGPLFNPSKKIFTRVAQGAGQGTLSEVPTEIGQQVLERWQANMPLDNPEALAEYREVGIAAGILGSGIGGTTSVFKGPSLDEATNTSVGEGEISSEVDDGGAIDSDVSGEGAPKPKTASGIGTYSTEGLKSFEAEQPSLGGLAGLEGVTAAADKENAAVQDAADRVAGIGLGGGNVDAPIAGLGGSQTVQSTKDVVKRKIKKAKGTKAEAAVEAAQVPTTQGLPTQAEIDKVSLVKDEEFLQGTTDASIDDANAKAEADLAEAEAEAEAVPSALDGLSDDAKTDIEKASLDLVFEADIDFDAAAADIDAEAEAEAEAEADDEAYKAAADIREKVKFGLFPDGDDAPLLTKRKNLVAEAKANAEAIDALLANPKTDPDGARLSELRAIKIAINNRLNALKRGSYAGGDYGGIPERSAPEVKPAPEIEPKKPAVVTSALSEEQPVPQRLSEDGAARAFPDASATGSDFVASYDNALNPVPGPKVSDTSGLNYQSAQAPVKVRESVLETIRELPPEQQRGMLTRAVKEAEVEAVQGNLLLNKIGELFLTSGTKQGMAARSILMQQGTISDVNEQPDITDLEDKKRIVTLLEMTDDAAKKGDAKALAARAFFKNFLRPVDAIEEMSVVSVLYAPSSSAKNRTIQKEAKKIIAFPKGAPAMASALNPKDGFVYGDTIYKENAEVSDAAYEFYLNETQEAALQALDWVENNMSDEVNNFSSDVLAEQIEIATNTLTPAERDVQIILRRERKSDLQKGRRDEDKQLKDMAAAEEAQQRLENSPEGIAAAQEAERRDVLQADLRAKRIKRMREEGGYDKAQKAQLKTRTRALVADYTSYIKRKNKAAAAASQGQPNQADQDQANLDEIKLSSTEEAYLMKVPTLANADLLSEDNVGDVPADILIDKDINQERMGLGLTEKELQAQFESQSKDTRSDDDYSSFLLASELYAQRVPLPPSIRNILAAGDLSGALIAVSNISPSKAVRSVAARLAGYTGDTKLKLVSGGITDPRGNIAAGVFDPSNNTITIDSNLGMNTHTLLHEVLHAGTAAQLTRKNLPEVRQLTRIYEAVKKQLPPSYATRSLDEFVAEAFSNPDFQVVLAGIPMSELKFPSAWENFKEAILRVYRNLLRRPPQSAFDRTDMLLDYILAPQLGNRAAPAMYLAATNPETAKGLAVSAMESVKPTTAKELDAMINRAKDSKTSGQASNFLYGIMPINLLADTLKRNTGSDIGTDLNKIINEISSKLRDKTVKLDYIVGQIKNFRKEAGTEKYKILQQLVPTSTLNGVDPSIDRSIYTSYSVVTTDPKSLQKTRKNFSSVEKRENFIKAFKAEKKNANHKVTKIAPLSKQKLVVYDALRKEYDSIKGEGAKDGQRVYVTMRNYFQETYNEIAPALRDRINSISDDAEVRKTAFDRLSELLLKDSGIIMPYFPLMRKGSYRLSYTAIDPEGSASGGPQVDRYVEYFPTKLAMKEAKQKVKDYNAEMRKRPDVIAANLDTIFDEKTGQSRPNPMLSDASMEPEATKLTPNSNFGKAPSSGFVFNVLNVLQAAGVQKMEGGQGNKVINDILDLSLDALPERSFMQGFRTRKGVRGFLGDKTPTGYSLENFDLVDMMETKGRDLNRQVVQLQGSAKIQKVMQGIKELTTDPDTAEIGDRFLKIAEFAQRPNVNRASQIVTNFGFNWTMGLNFSSAALTFFDVGMSVAPLLSGKYGASKTTRAFGEAARAIAAAPRSKTLMVDDEQGNKVREQYDLGAFGVSLGNLDFSNLASVPEGLRYLKVLVEYATNQAQMGQSLTQETLELDMYTGDTGTDKVSRVGKKILDTSQKWGGAMFHHSERYGREVSLVAAYNLEVDKLSNGGKNPLSDADKQKAAESAVEFVEFTLGGTASAGRPVYAQSGLGNILFLFKRFAISKYYMMIRMTQDATSLKPKDEYGTEEAYQDAVLNRGIARTQLANFLITTGLVAGVSGMPLFGELGILYDLIFKAEDEDNWDTMHKKWMADPVYGGLVDMTGLEIGDRIALNNMLYRPPLIEKDQNALFTLVEQLGGPAVGIASQWDRGADLISQGQYQRGMEAFSPAALRSVLKAGRYSVEGNLTMRGQEVTATSPFTIAGQALGFSSHAHIEQLNMTRNERQKQSAMEDRKRNILRRANMARAEGDVEGLRRAYKEAIEHNARLPIGAEKLMITTGKNGSFNNSYRNFQRNTEDMIGGTTYTPNMRRSAAEYG